MDSQRLPAPRQPATNGRPDAHPRAAERQGRSRAMARMNWSRVQRDKSLKNPPRPELDSPISAKGRHPVPAPPPPPKAAPPEDAPPKDLLPAARRPKPRRRLKTPRPGRQRTTFTCGSCRRELPIGERSVGFPKRCSSCVRGGPPPRQSMTNPPAAVPAEPQGPDRRWRLAPTIHRALRGRPSTAPRRAAHQILVDRGVMWQASCACGWAHPGSFRKKRNALRSAEQHLWQVDGQ